MVANLSGTNPTQAKSDWRTAMIFMSHTGHTRINPNQSAAPRSLGRIHHLLGWPRSREPHDSVERQPKLRLSLLRTRPLWSNIRPRYLGDRAPTVDCPG